MSLINYFYEASEQVCEQVFTYLFIITFLAHTPDLRVLCRPPSARTGVASQRMRASAAFHVLFASLRAIVWRAAGISNPLKFAAGHPAITPRQVFPGREGDPAYIVASRGYASYGSFSKCGIFHGISSLNICHCIHFIIMLCPLV